ncbi:MAG: carboxypeptidase regulatory-like domain-containing protein [Kofleriaceae bacterium]|nr:carboxypeptidase regulatory-like domain-containing protein [Kofleriaceae bacterium]
MTTADSTAEGFRLEGQVTDQRQRPVGGAKVSLGPGRQVVTEGDGSFAFDDLPEGEYSVIAEWNDAYAEELELTVNEYTDPVMLELARGPSVRVHVTREGGAPVVGALVRTSGRRTKTDADGYAMLRAVDFDSEYITVVAATLETKGTRIVTGDDPAATIEYAIELGAGTDVIGTVVDEAGLPVADAIVDLDQVEGARSERAHTDEHGAFTFDAIGQGHYKLAARSDLHVEGPELTVDVDGTAPVRTLVRVVRGAEVTGIVVDSQGRPIAGAEVHVGRHWVETKADGTFHAAGLAAGLIELGARTKTGAARTEAFQLAAREHRKARLVIETSSIAGIVVDANGQPVGEVSVFARSDDPQGYGHATTDAGGRFDLGGVPPGDYEITATREDSRHDGAKIRVAAGTRNVKLVVADRAGLTATVMLDGVPVRYYGYELLAPDDKQPWSPTAVRDANGTFTDEDAQPGRWTVAIVGPGFKQLLVPNVQIVAGRTTNLGIVRVQRGASMHGRVVDANGAAVANAEVRIRAGFSADPDQPLRMLARGGFMTRTRADGSYQFEGLGDPNPTAQITASHPTFGTAEVAIDGREVVDLQLAVTR